MKINRVVAITSLTVVLALTPAVGTSAHSVQTGAGKDQVTMSLRLPGLKVPMNPCRFFCF